MNVLILQQGPGAGRTYPLDPQRQPVLSMGRGSACDIAVPDQAASRHHCDLRWNGGQWEVVDRGSTNGTRLNGLPLTTHEPYALQLGDQVSIGDSVFVLETPAPAQPVTTVPAVPAKTKRHKLLVPILGTALAALGITTTVGAALLLRGGWVGEHTPVAFLTQVIIAAATITPTPLPTATAPPPTPALQPTLLLRLTVTPTPKRTGTPPPPPTTTAESPSPCPTASVAEAVQAEFDRLAEGRILYNPPEEMQVGHRERIEVRISKDPAAPLEAGLKGEGAPQVEAVPVSCFMKVRLQGETFEIVALSSEEQVIPAQGFTEWAWDITPKKSGDRSLFLIVTARVKLSGYADEQKDLGIIERQIHIKVNPAYAIGSFLKDNQGWIYTAILLPSAVALGRWLWKRYKGSKPSKQARRRPPGKKRR